MIAGPFDFSDSLKPLDDFRQDALNTRPDLQAALQTIQQSETNHKLAVANGSTDPTFSGWYTYNSSNNNPNGIQTIGASVSIPLRIFDRNQGEKQRTLIDIDRSQQASEAARAQVFSDVDSAYAQVESNIALLKPYKAKYTRGHAGARHYYLLLPAWRSFADGFSERAKRLPDRATGLSATDRRLSGRRRPNSILQSDAR